MFRSTYKDHCLIIKNSNGIGIWTIYSDKQGKLWAGTEGDEVYTFDGKKFNKF